MTMYLQHNLHTRPSTLLDQHFGHQLSLDDLLAPLTVHASPWHSVRSLLQSQHYCRLWKAQSLSNDQGSTIKKDNKQYHVTLDVQQFQPDEICVKIVNKCIVVEGKHEEKHDGQGFIARQFTRKYVLPEFYDIQEVQSTLSSDGVLTICAPKLALEEKKMEREIPITRTGPRKAGVSQGEVNKK